MSGLDGMHLKSTTGESKPIIFEASNTSYVLPLWGPVSATVIRLDFVPLCRCLPFRNIVPFSLWQQVFLR